MNVIYNVAKEIFMESKRGKQYINVKELKTALYLVGVVSFIAMVGMDYDDVFKITMLLPACYIICIAFFVKPDMGDGIGKIAILVMYAFRMCILPVLCAYGNFWLEPERSVYINYYGAAIVLSCFEGLLVFGALYFFHKSYRNKPLKKVFFSRKNIWIKIFVCLLLLIVACLYIRNSDFKAYFRLLISEEDGRAVYEAVQGLQGHGAEYYLLVLIDLMIRPILAFWATDYFLKRNNKLCVIIVGMLNVLIVTDRRIISLLVGGCCIAQILLYLKKDVFKKLLIVLVGLLTIITVCYCFYGTTEPYLIARKFQRYFSGPTLTAIGMAVNQRFQLGPMVFLKLLFNDSIVLTGLFNSIAVPSYVMEVCGPGGYSIWTPMMIGSVQYFGVFAPIATVLIVKFVVRLDYLAKNSESGLHRLMMNYLAVSVAVYMIMYTVELIFYTILFWGTLYKILIWLDKRVVWKKQKV